MDYYCFHYHLFINFIGIMFIMTQKITQKTRFFEIEYDPEDGSVKDLFNPINKAENKYFKIFKIKPNKFRIVIVYSRREFDKLSGFKTADWVDGHFISNKLIVFSPSIRKKYIKPWLGRYYSYNAFFDHEINHLFYISLVGDYNPVWLSEGYATYMMGQWKPKIAKKDFMKTKNPERFLFYRYIKRKYYKFAHEFYSLSFYVVKYLIEKYGHEKILTLIYKFSKTPNKKCLEGEFKELFGISIKEAVRNSII